MPEPSQETRPKTDTAAQTLLVALFVSLVCSSLVASAAVVLQPMQVENARLDLRRNILQVAGLYDSEGVVDELFESIEPRVVDLETGAYADDLDPEVFKAEEAVKDPEESVAVPVEIDIAKVRRRAKHSLVYLVREGDRVDKIILPISGYGLWSTLYGFLALEADGNTVSDITFYAHGETPGLGDFIVRPAWRALWRGKRAFDEAGELQLEVVKGTVPADDPLADYHVDGVSGATLTGNGVSNMMTYWLGDHGFGPFLKNIQKGGDS